MQFTLPVFGFRIAYRNKDVSLPLSPCIFHNMWLSFLFPSYFCSSHTFYIHLFGISGLGTCICILTVVEHFILATSLHALIFDLFYKIHVKEKEKKHQKLRKFGKDKDFFSPEGCCTLTGTFPIKSEIQWELWIFLDRIKIKKKSIIFIRVRLVARKSGQRGGGRNFERPNVERLIFRNLKITGEGQNFEQ